MGNQRARSRGLRHGTRNMFSRAFRKKGPNNAETYLRTFRVSASAVSRPGGPPLLSSREPRDLARARRCARGIRRGLSRGTRAHVATPSSSPPVVRGDVVLTH